MNFSEDIISIEIQTAILLHYNGTFWQEYQSLIWEEE